MLDNRVVLINRTVSSLSNTSAITGIHNGEWFLVKDTNTLYWKDTFGVVQPIGKSGTGGVVNTSVSSLSDTSKIDKVDLGEWVFIENEKTIYWRNPTTSIIEPLTPNRSTTALEVLSNTIIDLDLSSANYFYTVPLTKNASFNPINYQVTSGLVTSFVLEITKGGLFTINWWEKLQWEYGKPPILSDKGTTVLGFYGIRKNKLDEYSWRGIVISHEISEFSI